MRSRGVRLIVVMVTALLMASGAALALNQVDCSKNEKTKNGSTSTNPCQGTEVSDDIIGTDYSD